MQGTRPQSFPGPDTFLIIIVVRYLSMELHKGDWCVIYLFYFIMHVSVTCYSIIINVARVIEATETHFVYFVASKLMLMASCSFHFVM